MRKGISYLNFIILAVGACEVRTPKCIPMDSPLLKNGNDPYEEENCGRKCFFTIGSCEDPHDLTAACEICDDGSKMLINFCSDLERKLQADCSSTAVGTLGTAATFDFNYNSGTQMISKAELDGLIWTTDNSNCGLEAF
jgi:hypothetical protein